MRAKQRRRTLVAAMAGLALLLAACGNGDAVEDVDGDTEAAGVEELEIELASWGSPDHENLVTFLPEFERQLEELSGGAITLQHFEGGALAEDVDMPTEVPAGTVDMAWTTVNGWTGVIDATRLFDSPAMQLSIEELQAALADDEGLGGVLRERFNEAGAEMIAFSNLGPAVIVGNDELRVPSDLEGKSVRVFSEGAASIVDLAGGSPTSIAFAEAYTALQRGTVDAAHAGLQGVASQQMQEVTTHGLVPGSFFGTTMMGWVANSDWFNGLDEAQREIILEAAAEAERVSQAALIEGRQELIEQFAEEGLDIYVLESGTPEFEAWQQLVEPLAEADRESLPSDVVEALDRAGS